MVIDLLVKGSFYRGYTRNLFGLIFNLQWFFLLLRLFEITSKNAL